MSNSWVFLGGGGVKEATPHINSGASPVDVQWKIGPLCEKVSDGGPINTEIGVESIVLRGRSGEE